LKVRISPGAWLPVALLVVGGFGTLYSYMKVLRAIERGVEAAKQTFQPKKYQAAGKPVHCSHCGGDSFEMPPGLIGTFTGYTLQCWQRADRDKIMPPGIAQEPTAITSFTPGMTVGLERKTNVGILRRHLLKIRTNTQ
jgi:hypothetical protein